LSASETICAYLESLLLGSNGVDVHCVEGILVPSVVPLGLDVADWQSSGVWTI
jgi:hypothetical protein